MVIQMTPGKLYIFKSFPGFLGGVLGQYIAVVVRVEVIEFKKSGMYQYSMVVGKKLYLD